MGVTTASFLNQHQTMHHDLITHAPCHVQITRTTVWLWLLRKACVSSCLVFFQIMTTSEPCFLQSTTIEDNKFFWIFNCSNYKPFNDTITNIHWNHVYYGVGGSIGCIIIIVLSLLLARLFTSFKNLPQTVLK